MSNSELQVDLGAIVTNLRRLRAHCGGRDAIPAVKADAYGHGLLPVARALEPESVALGVAAVDEAAELRAGGITKPILKFSPTLPDELPAAIESHLTLTIASAAGVDEAARAAREAKVIVGVHLKVDTGMRRVGVPPEEAVTIAHRIQSSMWLRLDGVFTHLATADEAAHDDFTATQLAALRRVGGEIRSRVGDFAYLHAANSAGAMWHPLGGDDAFRPGIALYGSPPSGRETDVVLEPVARWTSRVSLVKPVARGEGVSYGLTWQAPADTRVATVPVGYGDGYSRLFSNSGRVLMGGRSFPVVGRVCMDQIMVDVGDAEVGVGDEVVLLGADGDERITVWELAEKMGTIPYEVTCLITRRVARSYVN